MTNQVSKEAPALAISVAPPGSAPQDAGRPSPVPPPPLSIDETVELVGELARALDNQCRRAHELLEAEPSVSPNLRVALQGVATRAREAADRAPALLAARPSAPPAPSHGANHPETRECAVALALTMKLEGAAPEDVETWLRNEFGREDATEIIEEAFGK
jgi:hypothetical protein